MSTTVNPLIQLRGNCQCCGRLQAVVNGAVAKHGYTVKEGWFNGVCSGSGESPMQISIDVTTEIAKKIRRDCVGLDHHVTCLEDGSVLPPPIKSSIPGVAPTPYALAQPWEQRDALRSAIWSTKNRAEMGRRIAVELETLAAARIGTPLVEALRDVAPPPIVIGEIRYSESGRVLKSISLQGARVYWKTLDDKPFKGWTGSSAWRRLSTTAP